MRIPARTALEHGHVHGHVLDVLAATGLPFDVALHKDAVVVEPRTMDADLDVQFQKAWQPVAMARTRPQGPSLTCESDSHDLCTMLWCECDCHPVRSARVMVDDLFVWPGKPKERAAARVFGNGKSSCHMTVDGPLVALHALAERIGMKRAWFQDHPLMRHYDLTPARRVVALREGAVFVPAMEQARERRRKRGAALDEEIGTAEGEHLRSLAVLCKVPVLWPHEEDEVLRAKIRAKREEILRSKVKAASVP